MTTVRLDTADDGKIDMPVIESKMLPLGEVFRRFGNLLDNKQVPNGYKTTPEDNEEIGEIAVKLRSFSLRMGWDLMDDKPL